jgi:hypothetical protein
MIYLIRNKPISNPEVSNFAMFDNAHGVALFMLGKDITEWSFALADQPYRPVVEICPDSSFSTIEKELNKLITPPTIRDRDNALNALMRKRACDDMPGYFIGVMNRCLKTKADIDKFIELCDRKDTKIAMRAIGDPDTYEITIHDGQKTLAEWRHHDLPT